MRAFGWSVSHVLRKHWLEDPESVPEGLERRLDGEDPWALDDVSLDEILPDDGLPPPVPAAAPTPKRSPAPPRSERGEGESPSPGGSEEEEDQTASPDKPAAPPPTPPAAPDPPEPQGPAAADDGEPQTPPAPTNNLAPGETRFVHLIGGTSKKCWDDVTVDGNELVVSFGRIGTMEQLKRKPFATPEPTRAEAERLIREKSARATRRSKGRASPRDVVTP